MSNNKLIFQLGTNNWQRQGEFAPGSGILHEAHHNAYNKIPGIRSYSMYPSKVQRFEAEDVKVFELEHDIPICESISPTSSYRWHGMSEQEVTAYRSRLKNEVMTWMNEIEERTGDEFSLVIAHHSFLNPVVMRDVINERVAAGKSRIPLLCFVHGTALKMYVAENKVGNEDEFPLRFLPMMENEKVFDPSDINQCVDLCAAISNQQIDALIDIFPDFPRDRVTLSPNGYNQDAFQKITTPTDVYKDRKNVLKTFGTQPYEGSPHASVPVEGDFDSVVVFCGKFADWKRLDALLHAAAIYEKNEDKKIATLIVGSGPHEDQVKMQSLALDELGLKRTFFLGPRGQDELSTLFNTADVGCFPSYKEPFGLVFIECMATGTPVIGADSGGPQDFVTPEVGALVPETDDSEALINSLANMVQQAIAEDWKGSKGEYAAKFAKENYSVLTQVTNLLEAVEQNCNSNIDEKAKKIA